MSPDLENALRLAGAIPGRRWETARETLDRLLDHRMKVRQRDEDMKTVAEGVLQRETRWEAHLESCDCQIYLSDRRSLTPEAATYYLAQVEAATALARGMLTLLHENDTLLGQKGRNRHETACSGTRSP